MSQLINKFFDPRNAKFLVVGIAVIFACLLVGVLVCYFKMALLQEGTKEPVESGEPESVTEEAVGQKLTTTTRLAVIPEEYGNADYVNFSSDGKVVVYGRTIQEWPAFNGQTPPGTTGDFVLTGLEGEICKTGIPFFPPLISPDGKHLAWVQEGSVILDGEKIGPARMGTGKLIFSPDSRRLAYDGYESLLIDGKEKGFYQEIGSMTFSPDSKHFVYSAKKESKWFVFIDGKEEGPYNYIHGLNTDQEFFYSPDSQHLAYIGIKGEERHEGYKYFKGDYFLVLDGKEDGPYHSIAANFVFSPDSQHFAYSVCETEDRCFIVRDGKKEEPYKQLPVGFTFSPDSQHLVYKTGNFIVIDKEKRPHYTYEGGVPTFLYEEESRWEGEYIIVFDGKKEEKHHYGRGGSVFSPDSKRFAYIGAHPTERCYSEIGTSGWDYRKIITIDGEEKVYDYVSWLSLDFSPDSKHFFYTAEQEKEWFAVLDGEEKGPYGMTGDFNFSPDSQHFAFTYTLQEGPDKKWILVLDNQKQSFCQEGCDWVGSLTFSPDSNHFAYGIEQKGRLSVVLDNKQGKEYDAIRYFSFSPDSNHFAYIAKRQGKWRVVLNQQESDRECDEIYNLSFDSSSEFIIYGARIANELWWIAEKADNPIK